MIKKGTVFKITSSCLSDDQWEKGVYKANEDVNIMAPCVFELYTHQSEFDVLFEENRIINVLLDKKAIKKMYGIEPSLTLNITDMIKDNE